MRWVPPDEYWVRINVDGTCRGNPGNGSYGFCVRDYKGDAIYSEADLIGYTSNVMAEATAVLKALQFGKEHSFNKILLESDSLSIIKYVKGIWKISWEVIDIMENI